MAKIFHAIGALALAIPCFNAAAAPWRNGPDPDAIAALVAGEQKAHANAAWWGFNPDDATTALQAAIDSGAREVLVPFMGRPWIITPIRLRGDLDLIFEPGVLVLAKRGEFKGGSDSLFSAIDVDNLSIRGPGATLRMWKSDYQNPPYVKAEWRMGIRISACKNVLIEGLRIESTGGDGIYIGGDGARKWSEDVVIRNVHCDDNHRQGISVISAQNLLIENSIFSGTSGTAPESGIDFEPNAPDERLVNCVVRNSLFENNVGNQMLVYLKPLDATSEPVSIRFERCHARMGQAGMTPQEAAALGQTSSAGISVGAFTDNGPKGLVEFVECTSENTGKEAVRIYDLSANSAEVRFTRCTWANPWNSRAHSYGGPRVPILIHARRPELSVRNGGVHFDDCAVIDWVDRPVIQFVEEKSNGGLFNIGGRITVTNPHGARMALGPKQEGVTLEAVAAE